MAERVAQAQAGDRDWTIASAGVSAEEAGHGIDFRAERQLAAHGYRTGDHVAHRITAAEVQDADLVVAATKSQVRQLQRMVPGTNNVRLLSDYDPQHAGSDLPDPYYEGGFDTTLSRIEAAMPALFAEADRIAKEHNS